VTPWGGVTTWRSPESELTQGGFETILTGQGYRFRFSSDDIHLETMKRALGCVLISLLPESGVDHALDVLWQSYEFACEDETLSPLHPVETRHLGIAVGDAEWD
jgi:hypothetical protein